MRPSAVHFDHKFTPKPEFGPFASGGVRLNGRERLFGEARFGSRELSHFLAAAARKNEGQALSICIDLHTAQARLTLYRLSNNVGGVKHF